MPKTLLLTLFALLGLSSLPARAQSPVSTAPDSWNAGTPMPTPRGGAFTGVIGNKIYVIGGANDSTYLNVNEVYDPATDTWSTAAPMPTARWLGGSGVVNNILYAIAGGVNGTDTNVVEAYDPATDTWSKKSPMPIGNNSVYAAVENNIIYVVGGCCNNGRLTNVLAYDPASDSWSTLAPLKVGKSQAATALIGSTIIAAGGLLSNSKATTDNEAYDAATNVWTTLAPLPTPRHAGCFEAVNDTLYFAGGHSVGNGTPLASMDAYNAGTNSWISGLPVLPHAVVNSASANIGGILYCFGGSDAGIPLQGHIFNYVQIYRPTLPLPSIGGVVSASDFGEFAVAAPGSWVEIYGTNLATGTQGWTGADFTGGVNAPTSLGGTSVAIAGKAAFIDYVSPGQVNALLPSDTPTGVQQIVLATTGGASVPFNITINPVAAGLLASPEFKIGGVQYAVAFFADNSFVLPTGAVSGLTSRPAKSGDIIVLYGVGFGPVSPDIPAGQLAGVATTLASDFHIFIGGQEAQVQYDGLAPSYTGLYQFNIVVPSGIPSGAVPLTFTVAGASSTQTLSVAVQN